MTSALPPELRAPVPGTSRALPQVPREAAAAAPAPVTTTRQTAAVAAALIAAECRASCVMAHPGCECGQARQAGPQWPSFLAMARHSDQFEAASAGASILPVI